MSRFLLFAVLICCFFSCEDSETIPRNVLLFTKTDAYRHASIQAGIDAIKKLGKENGFAVDATENQKWFSEERLKNYAAVIFLNTSGDVLDNRQQADFQRFIEAGGGFAGIHGAAATEYDWKWYGQLVGAYFSDHPAVQPAKVTVATAAHPATEGLPEQFSHTDEWYNFRAVPPGDKVLTNAPNTLLIKSRIGPTDSLRQLEKHIDRRVNWTYDPSQPYLPEDAEILLRVDENSYEGGKHGDDHPISWSREFAGGRSFYTALGHTIDSYSDSLFLRHLLGGIAYAMGEKALDYDLAKTRRIPSEDRFVRTVLASFLDEPMELEIFPDGRIMIVERKGAVKIYHPDKDTIETISMMPVYSGFEEGVLGVARDPDWENNKWIYLYYSLYDSTDVSSRRNRLSRFVFDDNMIHFSTEKMLLEVPELVGCCHAGGSVEFGPEGYLYLSTGDNTNPFESDGYAPIDERPGRALWDAQKSSGNPNDLRGKILRIKPEDDGTYSIPEGNLFPPGTPGTRPEIYVMGLRNPFRISVDSKSGCLYWGDVGPDAGKDGPVRGPKGYDTVNRACEAGNYGWPYVRGNHVYQDYNFAARRPGVHFDPENIINDSPNNTGRRELPPVQSPLIWYSYDESTEFPWTATGGKNPMAGPVFHAENFTNQKAGDVYPPYFEDKLFIYEWMRNWIYVVTLDETGNYVQADPFLPDEKFVRPMDMAFGPDGALYVLEYGEAWFARNPDARLNRIEFAPGNRRPVARIDAAPSIGTDPLTVKLSASGSEDYDGDKLSYEWILKGGTVRSNSPNFTYTFNLPGTYEVTLKVTDSKGAVNRAKTKIFVGNEPPEVSWQLEGNQTFYWDEAQIPYTVHVTDPEDGSLSDGSVDPRRVSVSIDYLREGKDVAQIILGHQTQGMSAGRMKYAGGKLLMDNSDCATCHAENRKINGPSYIDIANRYFGDEFAVARLADKVIKGGGGNWGETTMAAHPSISQSEAEEIVQYILSLAGEAQPASTIPFTGIYEATAHVDAEEKGAYIFQASYADAGARGMPSLSATETVVLRYPLLEAETYSDAAKGVRTIRYSDSDTTLVTGLSNGRFLVFENIDLTGVGGISLEFFTPEKVLPGSKMEVRLGGADGKLIGQGTLSEETKFFIPVEPTKRAGDVYLVFKNEREREKDIGYLDRVFFEKLGIER